MISDFQSQTIAKMFVWGAAVVVGVWMASTSFPDEASAILVTFIAASLALAIFRHFTPEKDFITTLFLGALVARLAFGLFIHVFELRGFFGGDALTYHDRGSNIAYYWSGLLDVNNIYYRMAIATDKPGWGMNYLVAVVYYVAGVNILAAQSLCAVIGAATAPMVYFCAKKIFANRRVAKNTALAVAFFPAFVIWSGQLLKDGVIVFLLVLAFTMVLQLQEKVDYAAILVLVLSLFGILTLRFYIFYMVAIAVAGSFVVGASHKSMSILRRSAALLLIGLALTYLGVTRSASSDIEKYADLERVQISRNDLARTESGFGEEIDVSTTEGAITTIPIGFAYLMLAPFPWQVSNLRQAITVPEVLLWWAMIPFMIAGIVYAIRYRLRSAFPILFFSLTLTLAYSIFQGNVGTAYRQRTQIQVFLFIFIAVGWELWKEKREDRRAERMLKQRKFERRLRGERDDHDDDDQRGYS